jgi:hypothetical protein
MSSWHVFGVEELSEKLQNRVNRLVCTQQQTENSLAWQRGAHPPERPQTSEHSPWERLRLYIGPRRRDLTKSDVDATDAAGGCSSS